jgi:hypothetical protein
MSDPLEALARSLESDSFFLASTLALFARSEQKDDAALAQFLRCPPETLTMLRLCRTPDEDPTGLQRDVQRIAERFGADEDALLEAVRRGQALRCLRQAPASSSGTLLAARDLDDEENKKS